MTDRILLVTPPDDIQLDGLRLLLVDLDSGQSSVVSEALQRIQLDRLVVSYVWSFGQDIDWLLDKKHKSDFIIFNAESANEIITGYMAAQKKAYYFGQLRCLAEVNDKTLYEAQTILQIIEKL